MNRMRKLKLQMQMSADGFVAGPNGEIDWAEWNWTDDIKNYVTKLTESVDCIILGRKLAQGFIPHWAANPDAEGADIMNHTAKVVFTKTLDQSEWDRTVLAKGDLVDEITQLKNQNGGDIIAYGGVTFVAALLQAGLIDELHLFVNPTAISDGLAIFKDRIHLKLVESRAFDCGIVVLHYAPK